MANATVTRSRVLACAAVLGATPAGADTAAPDHWLGTWAGTWLDGSAYTELRVTRIEPSGAVIGAVCDRPAGRPRFIVDIGPEGHIEARLKADTIRWKRPVRKAPPSRWQYTLNPAGTAQVQVTGPDARPGTARMIRHKAQCLDRWIAPGEATIPPAPAADSVSSRDRKRAQWLGTWVGVWTEGRGATELRIDQIDKRGVVRGSICQYWRGKARQIFDIGPNADFPAKHRGNTMRFRIQRPDGTQSRWRWRLTDNGLHMSYRARNSLPADFVLTRYRSRCLDRWRPALPDE